MIREDGDQTLLRASCTGDTDAFAKLYEKYQRDVYAVCLAILQDPCLAEDALQDTFLRAFLGLSRFKPGKPLGPWLRTIARRRCKDIRRRARDASLEELIENGVNLGLDGQDQFSDATFDEAINAQRLAKLRLALATLSSRQRRALLLQAVEGWSHADIAEVDGISIDAVNMLLVRARKKLKQAWDAIGGAFGLAFAPWRGLRGRLQAAIARVQRNSASAISDGWLTTGGLALVGAGLALVMTAQPQLPAPALAPDNPAGPGAGASRELTRTVATWVVEPVVPGSPRASSAPDGGGTTPLVPGIGVLLQEEPTPENTYFSSIAPSPSYEEDHTVFAADAGGRLFVTHDGGASWHRLPASGLLTKSPGFRADALLVAPGYVQNGIFAMGYSGLQQSIDGGRTFTTVSPVTGHAVISPAFAAGDRRIIIASNSSPALFEYLVDERETRLLSLRPSHGAHYTSLALSPRFPLDTTALLGRAKLRPAIENHGSRLAVRAYDFSLAGCKGEICQDVYSDAFARIKFSPSFMQDGALFALSGDKLLRSTDMMRTVEYSSVPLERDLHFGELALLADRGRIRLFLTGSHPEESAAGDLYYSQDNGATWTPSHIDLPGFILGVDSLAATPTGRLFASGSGGQGIACSQDGGRSWNTRCLPEV